MYRSGQEYDEIIETIIDVYIDYDIREFPIDEKSVCRKLGIALVPYSEFGLEGQTILQRKSEKGFFVKGSKTSPPTIYYNNVNKSLGEIRFTVFHELKHYVFEDEDDSEDDLADYFSRYFMCPIPYLLLKKIDTKEVVMSFCETSMAAATNVVSNIQNRRNKYGYDIFDYEIRLLNHLDPLLLEVYTKRDNI